MSTLPGNHFSGICIAPITPPTADTASCAGDIAKARVCLFLRMVYCVFVAAITAAAVPFHSPQQKGTTANNDNDTM